MMLIELKIYLTLDEYELLRDVAEAVRMQPADTAEVILRGVDQISIPTGNKFPLPLYKRLPFLKQLQAEGNYAG